MEKTIYELFDELVDEAMKRKAGDKKATAVEKPKAESAPQKDKDKPKLITVAYTYNDEGSDAHVILPADAMASPNAAASVTYALAYAIADTVVKGAKLGGETNREDLANEMLNAMAKKLLDDSMMSIFKGMMLDE